MEDVDLAKKQAFMNRIETSGSIRLDGLHCRVIPPKPLGEEDSIEFKITSVGIVPLVMLNGSIYVLLVQQADREGNPWEIPSGKIDIETDTSIKAAALRELREETGIILPEEKLIALAYAKKETTGGLQFFTKLKYEDLNLKFEPMKNSGILIAQPPNGVDLREIASIALEPIEIFGTQASLISTTAHPWAKRKLLGSLGIKLEMEL